MADDHRQLRPKKSTVFNLFSKPKVQKQRGYAESGLSVPSNDSTDSRQGLHATASHTSVHGDLRISSPSLHHDKPPPSRAASAPNLRRKEELEQRLQMPLPTTPSLSADSASPPSSPTARHHRLSPIRRASFTPPPLFQACAQSLKYGTVEIPTFSAETCIAKNSRKRNPHRFGSHHRRDPSAYAFGDGHDEHARHWLRQTGNSYNNSHTDLTKKMFVLVQPGYLLQYSYSGISGRLPEKVLQLGSRSAAFACDLISGRHHVLQISHAVDHQGVAVTASGSLLNKLGIKSAAAKRQTSNFLLVMPSAEEMSSWMDAIRAEIELLCNDPLSDRPDALEWSTAIRRDAASAGREDGAKSSSTSQHNDDSGNKFHGSYLPTPPMSPLAISLSPLSETRLSSHPRLKKHSDKGRESVSDTAEDKSLPPRPDDDSANEISVGLDLDGSFLKSSAGHSVDHKHLNATRHSGSTEHMSSESTPSIVATTAEESAAVNLESSTRSASFSPYSPELHYKQTLDSLTNTASVGKAAGHSVASGPRGIRMHDPPLPPLQIPQSSRQTTNHATTAFHRPFERQDPQDGSSNDPTPRAVTTGTSRHVPHSEDLQQSAAVSAANTGHVTFVPQRRSSLGRKQSVASLAEAKARHDSKMGTPPPTPPDSDIASRDRPQSFVADLPQTSAWVPRLAANRRSNESLPLVCAPPGQGPMNGSRLSLRHHLATENNSTELPRQLRASTPSFSIPLRINPASDASQPSERNSQRWSQNLASLANETLKPSVPLPDVVQTLMAHGHSDPNDPAYQLAITQIAPISSGPSPPQYYEFTPRLTKSVPRTSRRLSSSQGTSTSTDSQTKQTASGRTIKRPSNIRVSNAHASLLPTIRTPPPSDRSSRITPETGSKVTEGNAAGDVSTQDAQAHEGADHPRTIVEKANPMRPGDGDMDCAPNAPRLSQSSQSTSTSDLVVGNTPVPKARKGTRSHSKSSVGLSPLSPGRPITASLPPPLPPPNAPLPALPPVPKTGNAAFATGGQRPGSSSKLPRRVQSSVGLTMQPNGHATLSMRSPSAADMYATFSGTTGLGVRVS